MPATPISSPTDVSADISGLTQSTAYHFTLVAATSSAGTVNGADQTFQTTGPPAAVTQPASNITETAATLNATVNPFGFDTTCVFQYVDDATFQGSGYDAATSVPCVPADLGSGFDVVPVSADVSGLTLSTVYHFRVVATNSAGTTNGDDTTFRTAGIPVVEGEAATSITDASAILNATIIPAGSDTTCVFQYVTDAAFQATGYSTATSVPCNPSDVGSGFDPQSVTASATGLTPSTTYHFRAVATNADGMVTGADMTFQTVVAFMVQVGAFGGVPGSLASQFQTPLGVAAFGGKVYVADSGNARIQRFNEKGVFKAAWGWGVKDGQAKSQECTNKKGCQAGIPGAGLGQFQNPTSVAVDSSKGSSKGSVYVGDAGNNVVTKFKASGKPVLTIDGTTAPQGHFQSLGGVAVDGTGNVWTTDVATGNVDRFDSNGTFVQEFPVPAGFGSLAGGIAIDSTHGAAYLIINGNQSGMTVKVTLSGGSPTTIDPSGATALSLDPLSGNLYIDHGITQTGGFGAASSNVAVYGPSGAQIGTLPSLGGGATTNSQGLAYFSKSKSGKDDRLYVGDAGNDAVTIYGPRSAGAPFISAESATHAGLMSETLSAGVVPLGKDTTCTFQYVDSAHFLVSGYTNAASVPCSPADLGSGYVLQTGQALVAGLTVGTFYHFHVTAVNSAGTVTGPDQTFQVGPGDWTPFYRCPVDDPAMLATDGNNNIPVCVASNSSHGSITIAGLTTLTGNTNLQFGAIASAFTVVPPAGSAVISDPTPAAGGIIAIVSSAGAPSNFNLFAGLGIGMPIVTLPIKIQLTGAGLGPTCFIGTEMNPIILQPANTSLAGATAAFISFDADGTPDPTGSIIAIVINGAVQGDSTFAVPGASGCTDDDQVDALLGLPSPSGANNLVLLDASSNLALPNANQNGFQWSTDWHTAFGGSPPSTTTTTTSTTTTTT